MMITTTTTTIMALAMIASMPTSSHAVRVHSKESATKAFKSI